LVEINFWERRWRRIANLDRAQPIDFDFHLLSFVAQGNEGSCAKILGGVQRMFGKQL